ncbi:DUF1365 domain-containing protein [Rheinheimera sediminis]|uniref:DUF1365 domain-containing protein n=1 Tax=Rheinheimera sp. YQF-1 TaxID=2499626 RepID=UPI001C982071|nr:DUF1365 domain-containing protein [Rheinheimera sp. YQF-1]
MIPSGHALLMGEVGHKRYLPKVHGFDYQVHYFWLDLDELERIPAKGWLWSKARFAACSYRRADYLAGATDLTAAVRQKVCELGFTGTVAKVCMMSPLANWGYYFSPLTLYYCFDQSAQLVALLAEVSNTPWNERHYYLVPVTDAARSYYQHDKAFHVSPFNPMDMQYHWSVCAEPDRLELSITNFKAEQKIFSAWFDLRMQPFSLASLKGLLIRRPWQNVQVMTRIYWHAVKLFIKAVPVYGHPKSKETPR